MIKPFAINETLRLISSCASSISSRTSALRWSAKLLAAVPRPGCPFSTACSASAVAVGGGVTRCPVGSTWFGCSVSIVCARVDQSRQQHACYQRSGHDRDRRRVPALPSALPAGLRAADAGGDGARFQLAQEVGTRVELLGHDLAHPVVPGLRASREVLQALGPALDDDVAGAHFFFFFGGGSPVERRQILSAACLAARAAAALTTAVRMFQSSIFSTPAWVSGDVVAKPAGYSSSMEPPARSLPKPERQRLIESVVSRKRIGSQQELAEALAHAGCEVTQATI